MMGSGSFLRTACIVVLMVAGQAPAGGAENWFETGVAHLKSREFESAITAFSRVLETLPDDHEAYNNRGVAHSQLEQLEQAIADFNRALTLKPDYAAALLNRGISYRRQGHITAAVQDYQELIKSNPDYTKAYQNLSWILATCPDPRFRDGPRALALLQSVKRRKPQLKMGDNWAAAYAEMGDYARAAKRQAAHVKRIRAANTAADTLKEEQYWLERYGRNQARRDSYLVKDSDDDAALARKLLADLLQPGNPSRQMSAAATACRWAAIPGPPMHLPLWIQLKSTTSRPLHLKSSWMTVGPGIGCWWGAMLR